VGATLVEGLYSYNFAERTLQITLTKVIAMKNASRIAALLLASVLGASLAHASDFPGTWTGSLSGDGWDATMNWFITAQGSPTADSISGDWLWLSSASDWAGCTASGIGYPCTSTWKGSVTGAGTGIDILGIGGTTYIATLSGNTLSGTWSYPAGPGYPAGNGVWHVTEVPEPATLALLATAIVGLGLRRRRSAR
jgi:PEP-CTERM motif-containing protein